MPAAPGVYAWWARPGALPDIVGPRHPTAAGRELVYVGIAPDKPGGRRTMRDRLLKDHVRRTRKSTLRRALAAFLWEQEGWSPALSPDGRPTLDHESETMLTDWMHENLALTWVVYDAPWEAEVGAIAGLAPPLNVAENATHPLYRLVRERRARWAEEARAVT